MCCSSLNQCEQPPRACWLLFAVSRRRVSAPLGSHYWFTLCFCLRFCQQVPAFDKFPFSLDFVDTSSPFWRSRGCRDIFQIDLFDRSQSDGSEQFVKRAVQQPVYVTGLIRKVIGSPRLCWNEQGPFLLLMTSLILLLAVIYYTLNGIGWPFCYLI